MEIEYTTNKRILIEDERGDGIVSYVPKGHLPSISIFAETIPEAWELAVLRVWEFGAEVGTHYDKSGDPKSREATTTIEVLHPFQEPRIHKNFPGGPVELESYIQEVNKGIHDHHINPQEKKWTYTYHERLFNYNPSVDLRADNRGFLLDKGVNQIEKIVDDLERDVTSKGAQATTWMPTADPGLESNRPCLQRLWFRVLEDKEGQYVLNLNSDWRSRDLYKAWLMNVYAITELQKNVAEQLSERIDEEVGIGTYRDKSDSLHIYGAYFEEAREEIKKMGADPDISKRVWKSDHPAFKMMIEETREKLKEDPDFFLKGGKLA